MRKVIVLVALTLFLLPISNGLTQDLTKVADNVYAYVARKDESAAASFAANAGIIIGKDGVLVVDTLVSAQEAFRFLSDIRKVTDKPIKYVVNTHTHLDHALGNCLFADMGATIISHDIDRETMVQRGEETLKNIGNYGLTPEVMAGTRISLPTVTFTDRMWLDLGGIGVELIQAAPSHTAGSLIVSVPSRKLVFAGDVLFTDFHPFLAEGDFGGWQKSLAALLAMDINVIIPGHGPLSTKKDLRDMKDYLQEFDRLAKKLSADSQDPEVIAAEIIKKLPPRSMGLWMVAYNVKSKYLDKKE